MCHWKTWFRNYFSIYILQGEIIAIEWCWCCLRINVGRWKWQENYEEAQWFGKQFLAIPCAWWLGRRVGGWDEADKQSSCWVLWAALHSWNFPLGRMYSGHIHSEISCSVGTDKKAVWLGNNCAPFRQSTDWCVFQWLSQKPERRFCVQVLNVESLVPREQ